MRGGPETTFTVARIQRLVDTLLDANERSLYQSNGLTIPDILQPILTARGREALTPICEVTVRGPVPSINQRESYMRFLAAVIIISSASKRDYFECCGNCDQGLGIFSQCRAFILNGSIKLNYGCLSCYVRGFNCSNCNVYFLGQAPQTAHVIDG